MYSSVHHIGNNWNTALCLQVGDGGTQGRPKVPHCEAIPVEGDEEGGDPDRVAEEDAPLCVSSPLAVVIPVPSPPEDRPPPRLWVREGGLYKILG